MESCNQNTPRVVTMTLKGIQTPCVRERGFRSSPSAKGELSHWRSTNKDLSPLSVCWLEAAEKTRAFFPLSAGVAIK